MGSVSRSIRILLTSALASLVVLLAACVDEARPSGCDAESVEIRVQLDASSMTPADPSVCRGQQVTLVVESAIDADFDLHGYDDAVPSTPLAAGESTTIEFLAERAGQFPIEIHPADGSEGVEVGIFTVNVP